MQNTLSINTKLQHACKLLVILLFLNAEILKRTNQDFFLRSASLSSITNQEALRLTDDHKDKRKSREMITAFYKACQCLVCKSK